ncbi:sigma-70 family RNA polymerase sigma factor [Nakamurella flavida]|uniref:Sigma-70 family RNA polymerase sigma factor n=1 Tax=Nakamurella flavida TaxID=363630 RepID=A0A938YDD2_9ACTN|nr:sigma-70 family RNA polymerase sigma factor [Nakamurella flavida]MBM9475595.1 sigma-70 family RNA polymerase sigma factor [Nakamurella flavida]MDP9778129.1 RNA polymerase sigma-70 factor (ECF subfamily) [Nakamurella flavida]
MPALTRLRSARPPGLRDEAAVQAAYTAHGAELYRFALRALGDPGLAQDAVQETFLRAWRAADRFDPELASLRVWLFAIVRNVVIDLARRRSAASFAHVPGGGDEDIVAALDPTPDDTDAVVNRWLVEEALGRISAEHRHVIVQTHLRGRPYDEVAAESGVPTGTMRSRAFYALKALRVAMDEMGVTL